MYHLPRPLQSVGTWLLIVLLLIGAIVALRIMARGGDAPTAPAAERGHR